MNNETAQEIFDHMFSLLEVMETQNAATLQLLKAKGIVTDEELAPHLDQAGNASSVRWRAARVRINYLLSSAKPTEKSSDEKEPPMHDQKESKQQESEKQQASPTPSGDKVQERDPAAKEEKAEEADRKQASPEPGNGSGAPASNRQNENSAAPDRSKPDKSKSVERPEPKSAEQKSKVQSQS